MHRPFWRSCDLCVSGLVFKIWHFRVVCRFCVFFGREKRRRRVPGLVVVDWRTYVDHPGVVTLLQVMQH